MYKDDNVVSDNVVITVLMCISLVKLLSFFLYLLWFHHSGE